MNKPLEITFQGGETSEAVEAKIAEKAAKLERHFDSLTHIRTVVSAPHRHSRKGKIYQIKMEIGIPDRAPVRITHEPEVSHANEDLLTAIRDSFEAAQRRLDDAAAQLTGIAKIERGRRRPSPVRH